MVSFGAIAKRLPPGGAVCVYSSEICLPVPVPIPVRLKG